MEDRKRIILSIAIAFLVLVLVPPRMVTAGEFPTPTLTPEELEEFFRDNVVDIGNFLNDHLPRQGQQGSKPGDGSNGGGQRRRQGPATNAGMYLYSYQVGTPPQNVTGALDISSELLWTQCDGFCASCGGVTPATPFYSTRSTTMALVPCTSGVCQNFAAQSCSAGVSRSRCFYIYGGGEASTTGYLATESFTFGATPVDDVVFGCGRDSVIGLGRGPLTSKLGRFSYYFASSGGNHSFILFGNAATPQTKRTRATPLLDSGDYPNAYLVGLTGIQVDGKDLVIPQGTFSGGVVLSIAIPVTFLAQSAYNLLKQALVNRIGLPTVRSTLGLDVCYTSKLLATVNIPSMALVFDYGNAVMNLDVGNYFFLDVRSGVECLTILPSRDGDVSLLGSLIQAGTHMIYDIRRSTLTFESLSSAAPPHIFRLLVLFANFLWVAYMIL